MYHAVVVLLMFDCKHTSFQHFANLAILEIEMEYYLSDRSSYALLELQSLFVSIIVYKIHFCINGYILAPTAMLKNNRSCKISKHHVQRHVT